MLRLRTTTSLSLLALLIGAVGTHWLSGLGADWQGLAPRVTASRSSPAGLPRDHSHMAPPHAGNALHARRGGAVLQETRAAPMDAPQLVPISMPADTNLRWHDVRDHLDGLVVLQLDVDAAGQVRTASVAQSSGDQQLDAQALRNVRRWRFAVPAGYPDGLRGELPMRFSSHAVDFAGPP